MGADEKNLRNEDHERDLRQPEVKDASSEEQEAAPGQEQGMASEGDQASMMQVQQELADYKDRYMRAIADLENLRRRHEKERQDLMKYGNEGLLRDFLPVLDAFEKALPANIEEQLQDLSEQATSFVDGMLMIRRQLLSTLQKHGLAPIEAAGQKFDPNLHEAIQRIGSKDVETDLVKDEYVKGYLLNGRLLRATMVSVLTPE